MQPYKYDIKRFLLISASLGILSNSAFSALTTAMGLSYILNIGFATSVVGLFWFLFDQFFWRTRIFQKLGISELPDLNGVWVGEIDRLGENKPHRFELRVFQTYSKISIQTNSGNSKGNSICAMFLTDETRRNFDIVNYWSSRTKSRDPNTDHHEEFKGLSLIDIRLRNQEIYLEDYYFTDRNPPSKGKVMLKRLTDSQARSLDEKSDLTNSAQLEGQPNLCGNQAALAPSETMSQLKQQHENDPSSARMLDCEIEIMRSNSGVEYLACRIVKEDIRSLIERTATLLGERYEEFEANRVARDGSDYHITIVSPREYNSRPKYRKKMLGDEAGNPIRFEALGLGRISKDGNEAYYVVLSSEQGATLRERYGLDTRDFHITIGFSLVDVHGVAKDKGTLIYPLDGT